MHIEPEPGGCWLWTGCGLKHYGKHNKNGYGRIKAARGDNRLLSPHRAAYELWVGPVPFGHEIDHLCRVRNCVNPAHLEAVTHQENQIRGWAATKAGEPVSSFKVPDGVALQQGVAFGRASVAASMH